MTKQHDLPQPQTVEPNVSKSRREIFDSVGRLALGGGAAVLLGCKSTRLASQSQVATSVLTGSESVWFDRIKSTGSEPSLKTVGGGETSKVAFVRGYWQPGDGGGGMFYWDPADNTSVNNDGTVIQTEGVSMGRWKRL